MGEVLYLKAVGIIGQVVLVNCTFMNQRLLYTSRLNISDFLCVVWSVLSSQTHPSLFAQRICPTLGATQFSTLGLNHGHTVSSM